ncbi:N-acetylneuraminate synthase [Salibacteraceae bacterium]|mgnify:FL=1|jgi:N,N'-diacetyllegionaminate synthase|nr:N-acetylneuraminate synthase [Salibacteraceae bacterium]MDB9709942.1 N-acetylneuraminate synthase [Salibacteraceae bacterium]MDC1304158.1 N-acetylneuraminate synthase [Salibacteraceae bacterium]
MKYSFSKHITIGNKVISNDHPAFIIAEAGVNHGGDVNLAKELIDIAVQSGADAVKFQAFKTENLILESVEKAPYQQQTTSASESQFNMLKKLELRKDQYQELKDYCEQKGIIFLITPFDKFSLGQLEELGVEAYKVASTDTTNLPFLKKIALTGKPILLSTGMSFLDEVKSAMQTIHEFNKDVVILQCTANYPIEDSEANLNVMDTYGAEFGGLVGYSDHSVGLGAAPYAVAKGAKVVEKHFTIDKLADGPDHRASLDPAQLKEFVLEVRRIELFLGSSEKKPTNSEMHTRKSLQKYLVAARTIKAGALIKEEDLVAKRTGGVGISPMKYLDLVGTIAKRDFNINDIIDA